MSHFSQGNKFHLVFFSFYVAVTESRMKEATNQIIALCTEQRNVNFQRNARILGELRVKKSKKKAGTGKKYSL